jgi:hypothetical protein
LALALLRADVSVSVPALAWVGALAAFTGWVWLSGVWTRSGSLSLLEGQRDLVYVAAAAAAVLLVDVKSGPAALAGVVAAVTGACSFGFVVEVLPELSPTPQRIDNLAEPIGYPNAMGLLAALAAVLALVFAVDSRRRFARACGGAALALLIPCLYLSLARGPWLALALGLATTAALHDRPEFWKSAVVLVPLPVASAVAVAVVPAGADAAPGSRPVRFLASLLVCVAAAGEGMLAARLPELARRLAFGRRRIAVAAAVPAAIAFAAAASARTLTGEGVHSRFGGDLADLLTLSGHRRGMYWSTALDGYAHHPLLGSGAGTFEQLWLLYRPTRIYNVLDAHNAYLEVLAELGPFGVLLFAAAVAVPLLAVRRAPRTPLVAGAAGAYAAYAAHVAIDWDWEIPAVTVVALLCGSTLVAGARRVALGPAPRAAMFAAAIGVAAISLAGLLANGALWEGSSALQRRDFARARAEAATAERWDLWSAEPEQLRAETELAAGNRRVAAVVLRRAVRREPNSYWLWADLAEATIGHERRAAIQRAESLNPLELPLSAP